MKRLVSKTRVGIGNQPNYVTTYAYDAASRVISETITGGSLSTTATYTYNTAGQPVTVVDHQGLVTTYSYESGVNTGSQCHGEVVTKTLPGGFKSIQAAYCDGQVSAITGDAQVAQYYDYGINADGSQWGMEYSAQADSPRWQKTTVNMLSQVQKKERSGYNGTVTESYTYNDKAQAVKVSKTGSADMLIIYDELGNQIRSGYDLDESGALEAASNDLIIDLAQTYEKIDSDWWQTQTQSTYATAGSNTATVIQIQRKRLSGFSGMLVGETQQTDVWGNTVSSFTMLDREAKQVTRNITRPDSSVQEQTVTVNGLTISNRSKSNQTATYSYDGLRRLSSVTEPRVGTTSITYHTEAGKIGLRACVTDPAGNTTTYDYDSSSGRLLWEKNALNQYTRYAYNSFGRQTMIWGDTQYPVTLGYDAYGQQISLKTYRTGDAWNSASWPGASLAGDQTTWTYDAASGLVTAKTDAAGNATTYTYTTDGRLASRTWARQVNGDPLVTTFSYNALGSLLKVDYSDATPDITITYNRIGQPVTVQDAAGTRNFAYNANLGLISETVSGIYNKTLTRTYTTAFGKGKVLSMSIGNVNNYTYDYDTYGRLNKIATPAGDFIYTRPSDSDLVTAMARPNNVTSNWTFEEHRNLLSQVANGSVSTYTYTNDVLGRRTNVTRSGSAFSDTNILTYGYNSRSELTSALSNINANYNFAYSYDPIGNRLNSTLAGTAWSYTSNNLNQYTALTSGNTTQSPAYDADGNMTFRDGWTQVWNGENRLVEMYNDTAKLTFSYDYMGRRIEKKVFQQTGGIWAPQKSLQYVYDGYKLVEEIDTLPDEKPVIRRYTWQPESQGADLPLVVTDVASDQSYFYTADGNKNISELVDAAGNIAAHYEYDPFGKINTQNGAYAANNPFRFSSEYFDDETGLVYYNYRYYSPELGRWINRDPIGERGGVNLYIMVDNSPINKTDLLGLECCGKHKLKAGEGCCNDVVYNLEKQCCIDGKDIYDKKPIDTGVSINQGYVTIINEIWVDVNAPLGGGLGMGYPPHIPQYVKTSISLWSHTYIQSDNMGFGLYATTQRPGGPSSATALYGDGYIATNDLQNYPPGGQDGVYATRSPILLSPCEYDIGKFKSCVNAAASSSNTDYRLIWKNCITFANGVVRNCKANAKR